MIMDPSSSTSTTAVSEHALRSAALSTLKAKRRKPVRTALLEKPSVAVPPRPPPPSDTFQLDYGFEEENSASGSATVGAPVKSSTVENTVKQEVVEDEGQSREEGEISEEEEPPPPPKLPSPAQKQSKSPHPATHIVAEYPRVIDAQHSTPVREPTSPSKSPTPHPHSTPMEGMLDPINNIAITEQKQERLDVAMAENVASGSNPSGFFVDSDHVRPGLSLTQEEYDVVKDTILDLLGWNVPFEAFIENGVSKEVMYYVFNELNLQLPDTFDASGIMPYTPDILAQSQQSATDMTLSPRLSEMRTSMDGDVMTAASIRPITPPPSTTVSAHILQSPNDNDLHDMERQRRQELIARKAAVAASRKSKSSSVEVPVVASHPDGSDNDDEDMVMGSVAPTETVDDFLNSLAPVQVLENPAALGMVSGEGMESQNRMDVDDNDKTPEHEQVLTHKPQQESASDYTTPTPTDQSFHEPPPLSSGPPPSSSEPPPTPVDSASMFSALSDEDPISPSTAELFPQRVERPPVRRRGTKRPVAVDFVDFDSEPRKQDSIGETEQSNGFVRSSSIPSRSGASFYNVGGARRCVIDLSDSEDEQDVQREQSFVRIVNDQRVDTTRRGRVGQYPSPAPQRPSSGGISPAILEQKELEIRKMRELIARREEETRLKKLAMAKSALGPDTRAQSTTPSQPVSPKQEEADVILSSSITLNITNQTAEKHPLHSMSSSPPSSGEDSRFSQPGFSNGVNQSSTGHEGSEFDGDAANSKIVPSQDLTPEAQESPVPSEQDQQAATLQSTPLEGPVDADTNSSPSTQVNRLSTPPMSALSLPILQEQDARNPPFSDSSHSNDDRAFVDSNKFSPYYSPFESYPRLLDSPRRMFSDQDLVSHDLSSHSPSHMFSTARSSLSSNLHLVQPEPPDLFSSSSSFFSSSSSSLPLPDLKPLKLMASVKLLDPSKRLCQYEIPGGGTCRDASCEDLHLTRLEGANTAGIIEPSDPDTAQYLFDTLPNSWLAQYGVTSPDPIFGALHQVDPNRALGFEERVAQALLTFGPPPTT